MRASCWAILLCACGSELAPGSESSVERPASEVAPCATDADCRLEWVAPCSCIAVLRTASIDPGVVPPCTVHPCSAGEAACDAATHTCVVREVELTPDPITRPLDEGQARQQAARLANAAYASDTELLALGPPPFSPESMTGALDGETWRFRDEPPAGPWARVSFGRWGDHPSVEVGYANQ